MSCGLVARFKTQVFLLWLQVFNMLVLTHKTYNCCLPGHWCSFSALPESNVLSYKMETHACLMKASGQKPHWGPCCQIEHTTHWCNIAGLLWTSQTWVWLLWQWFQRKIIWTERDHDLVWQHNCLHNSKLIWTHQIWARPMWRWFQRAEKAAAPALRHKPELLLAPHSSSERRTQCDI